MGLRDLSKPPEINAIGQRWLDAVHASKLGADAIVTKIAAEIAGLVGIDGRGRLGSAIDLSKPANLTEADAVFVTNRLARHGYLLLEWRPAHRTFVEFRLIQPGDALLDPDLLPLDGRSRAEAIAAAAAAGLDLKDAVPAIVEALARILINGGIDPARKSGADFLDTTDKLIRSRVAFLIGQPKTRNL